MICLIDLDSILYKAVYKVVSYRDIKNAIELLGKEEARQWMLKEVYEQGINRVEKQILEIVEYLDSVMVTEVQQSEIFITTNKNCPRKKLAPTYKAKRKKNNYVWLLRNHFMINDAKFSDTLEADDLIQIRAKELGKENCIIVSPDKDLKQIGGFYWSYYKQKVKGFDGEYLLDEYKKPVKEFKQKEPIFISDKEAERLFWCQMLSGDKGDGIDGILPISAKYKKKLVKQYKKNIYCKVGEVNAKKILSDSKNYFIAVAREYILRGQKQDFKINYELLRLGKR